MRLSRITLPVLLILAALLAVPPIQAQGHDPEPHPLIQMMAMAPAEAAAPPQPEFLQISYVDVRAAEQARPGVVSPASSGDFLALDEAARDLWIANSNRLIGMPPDIPSLAMFDAGMVNYLGLDFFEIDRTFAFGPPPDQGTIYGGHFDTERISQTLIRRTYTAAELNGIPVLCGPIGCENGETIGQWLPDQRDMDPQTFRRSGVYPLFGGRLGRQEPLALLPGFILSTPNWDILGRMTAAAAGTHDSLYDLPDYRAMADYAVAGVSPDTGKSLIQILFFPPTFFMGKPLNVGDLPFYSLGALIDWQEGADQVHGIVLVYTSESDAQRAAAEVARRIPRQLASPTWETEGYLIDLAVSSYTLEPPQVVYNADADRWLAVAAVRTPLPGNAPDPENENRIRGSGRLLVLWYTTMMNGYFVPAQLTPPGE